MTYINNIIIIEISVLIVVSLFLLALIQEKKNRDKPFWMNKLNEKKYMNIFCLS